MLKSIRRPFDYYFELCCKYKEQYGNLEIPIDYITEGGIKLGNWCSYQRRHSDRCTPEHRKMLDDIGFVWHGNTSWMALFEKVKAYYEEFGSLDNIDENTVYLGSPIGIWLAKNRIKKRNGKMSKERIRLLDSLHFDWNSAPMNNYIKFRELFKEYFQEFGHLLPSVNEVYKGEQIGIYVARLRRFYRMGTLSQEKIDELEAIGMEWDGKKGFWKYNFNLCEEYINNGGILVAQTKYKNQPIGTWYFRQDVLINRGSLDESQINALKKLRWNRNYLIVKQCVDKYSCNLQLKNHCSHCKMENWINEQKQSTLTDNELQKLIQIGVLSD